MVVPLFLQCKKSTCYFKIIAAILLIVPYGYLEAQTAFTIQQQQTYIKELARHIVEINVQYEPQGLEDPEFLHQEFFLGVIVAKHRVVTSWIWFKRKAKLIRATLIGQNQWGKCELKKIDKTNGYVVIECPGILGDSVKLRDKKVSKGEFLYSLQKVASRLVLIKGIVGKKPPEFLKHVFFIKGLKTPGTPLFDVKGNFVGLIVRPSPIAEEKIGVCIHAKGISGGKKAHK